MAPWGHFAIVLVAMCGMFFGDVYFQVFCEEETTLEPVGDVLNSPSGARPLLGNPSIPWSIFVRLIVVRGSGYTIYGEY